MALSPSRHRSARSNFPTLFPGELSRPGLTAFLAAEPTKRHGGRVLLRSGFGHFLHNLARGNVDNQFCKLVDIAGAFA